MFCKECGKELAKGAKFCMFCGSLNETIEKDEKKEVIQINPKKDKKKEIAENKKDALEQINKSNVDFKPRKTNRGTPNFRTNKAANIKNKVVQDNKQEVLKEEKKEKVIPVGEVPVLKEIEGDIVVENIIDPTLEKEVLENEEVNLDDTLSTNNDILPSKEEITPEVQNMNLDESTGLDNKDICLKENNLDEILEKITSSIEIAKHLYPLSIDTSVGFRSLFIGDAGTKKDEIIHKVFDYLKEKGKVNELKVISFSNMPESFDLDKLYVICDFETAISYLFNLESFSEEASQTQMKYKKMLENLITADGTAYIICDIKEHLLRSFHNLDLRLSYLFENKIFFKDLNYEDIYNEFKEKVNFKFTFDDAFKNKFYLYLDKNRRYFPFKNKDLAVFLADYVNREGKMIFPEDKIDNKSMEEFFEGIYGLEDIKSRIRDLDIFLQSKNRLVIEGVKFPAMNLHMMFLGNPGCGKTTLARYIGKILFERGFLRENKFIEVTSKDLVAGAQTGIKTSKLIQESMGGVLFIDEAYSLVDCGQAGAEAIAILIKAMEDHKDDIVVMLAGYTKEMGEFVDINSGIVSRINYTFKFNDYNKEELYEIFKIKLANTGMKIKEEDEPEIKIRMIDDLLTYSLSIRNSGNGRFIDRVIQSTLINHAKNQQGQQLDKIITLSDIPQMEDVALK